MFLGIDGIVVKCHGSSDRKAIANGIIKPHIVL